MALKVKTFWARMKAKVTPSAFKNDVNGLRKLMTLLIRRWNAASSPRVPRLV